MDCPVCKEPMVVLEYDEVEVDYCLSCKGLWLDAGELELLTGDPPAAFKQAPPTKEKPRRCPICRGKMTQSIAGGPDPVTLDQCSAGHGLWFDEGELERVLHHGAAAECEKISAFLKSVFGKDLTESENHVRKGGGTPC